MSKGSPNGVSNSTSATSSLPSSVQRCLIFRHGFSTRPARPFTSITNLRIAQSSGSSRTNLEVSLGLSIKAGGGRSDDLVALAGRESSVSVGAEAEAGSDGVVDERHDCVIPRPRRDSALQTALHRQQRRHAGPATSNHPQDHQSLQYLTRLSPRGHRKRHLPEYTWWRLGFLRSTN